MGAPISAPHEDHIIEMWRELLQFTDGLPLEPEPVEMLNLVADIIGKCWHVRRAVDDAWFYANKRAFSGPEAPRPRAKPKSVDLLQELEVLDVSPDELAAALAAVRK